MVDIWVLIGALGTVIGIFGTIIAMMKSAKTEVKEDANSESAMKADIKYIRKLTEDMVLEQRDTNKTLMNHGERIIILEQEVKNINKDIDEVKSKL